MFRAAVFLLLFAAVSVSFEFYRRSGAGVLEPEIKNIPSALWCEGQCYFMDEAGLIYEEAPDFSAGAFRRFYGGSLPENPIGLTFLNAAALRELDAHFQNFAAAGLSLYGAREAHGDFEGYLSGGSDASTTAKVLWSGALSAARAKEILEAIFREGELYELKNRDPRLTKLTKLDLRFEGKVYYIIER